MTLKQKRKIVVRFKAGEPIYLIALPKRPRSIPDLVSRMADVEQVIRDFMNNKFSLKAKKREK